MQNVSNLAYVFSNFTIVKSFMVESFGPIFAKILMIDH